MSVRARVGFSRSQDVTVALREASRGLEFEPACAVVLASPDLLQDTERAGDALSDVLAEIPHAGMSSDGIRVAGEEAPVSLAVVFVGGDVEAHSFALSATAAGGAALGLDSLGEALDELEGDVSVVVGFVDPRGPQAALLPGLLERLAPGTPVVGGGATGRSLLQICDGHVSEGLATGLCVRLSASKNGVMVAHGALPVGRRGLVTKAEGSLLLEVDGEPASVLLDALRDASLPVSASEAAPLLGLALAPDGVEALEAGQYVVRNLVGVEPGRKALAVAARLEPGWAVSLVLREAIGARQSVAGQAESLAGALGGPGAFGLYFDCASRGEGLYGVPGVDEAQILRAFPGLALVSARTSFELGPLVVQGLARPELQLYCGVLWVPAA